MKTSLFVAFSIAALSSVVSFASTDFAAGSVNTTLTGAAPSGADISAFVIMAPKYTFNKRPYDQKIVDACTFEEDSVNPNGNKTIQHLTVKRDKDGTYTLLAPVSGSRGSCEYIMDSIYYTLKYGSVDEMLKIRSDASVNYSNILLGTFGPESTLKLEPKGTITCEFSKSKSEDSGNCYHDKDMLIDDLQIKASGESFTLDFKDKPKNIFDTQAISLK